MKIIKVYYIIRRAKNKIKYLKDTSPSVSL